MENPIKFRRTLIKFGDSLGITLPKELTEYLEAEQGTQFVIVPQQKKKGKFIAIWKEKEGQHTETPQTK